MEPSKELKMDKAMWEVEHQGKDKLMAIQRVVLELFADIQEVPMNGMCPANEMWGHMEELRGKVEELDKVLEPFNGLMLYSEEASAKIVEELNVKYEARTS